MNVEHSIDPELELRIRENLLQMHLQQADVLARRDMERIRATLKETPAAVEAAAEPCSA